MSSTSDTTDCSIQLHPTCYKRQLDELRQRIANTEKEINLNVTCVNENKQQIAHLERLITYIHMLFHASPLAEFRSYCSSHVPNVPTQTQQYEQFMAINKFPLTTEDTQLLGQNMTVWQKVALVERKIGQIESEVDCLERDKEKLEKIADASRQLHNQLLEVYQSAFKIAVKLVR